MVIRPNDRANTRFAPTTSSHIHHSSGGREGDVPRDSVHCHPQSLLPNTQATTAPCTRRNGLRDISRPAPEGRASLAPPYLARARKVETTPATQPFNRNASRLPARHCWIRSLSGHIPTPAQVYRGNKSENSALQYVKTQNLQGGFKKNQRRKAGGKSGGNHWGTSQLSIDNRQLIIVNLSYI